MSLFLLLQFGCKRTGIVSISTIKGVKTSEMNSLRFVEIA